MSTTRQKRRIIVDIRQVVKLRKDMPKILAIEEQSFEFIWSKDDFVRFFHTDCSIMIAKHEKQVIGFMVYKFYHHIHIHLLNFAVAKNWLRHGVGTQMIAELVAKLSEQNFRRIILAVPETNLPAQLFLRECGFKSVNIIYKYYSKTSEDAYVMQYRYKTPPGKIEKDNLFTRITKVLRANLLKLQQT